ncbi:MAG: AEC family transporter, partial [Sphingobacterium sp.]
LIVPRIIDLSFLDDFFGSIASTVSPIALFSIGLQLNFGLVKQEVPNIAYAALYKLIIGPAILVLLAFLLELKGEIIQVSLFEMAMPSLVATSIVLH